MSSLFQQYIDDVVNHTVVTNQLVKKSIQRHLDDLAKSHATEYPYEFRKDIADYYIDIWPKLFYHFKGSLAGKPFHLAPYQAFIVGSLLGWVRKDDPTIRRFRFAYIEMARKQGKSTLMAALGILFQAFLNEPSARVYTVATKMDQAREVWGSASRMINKNPILRNRFRVYHNAILFPSTDSSFQMLASEANTLDGLDSSFVCCDEMHAHPSSAVYDVMASSLGNRVSPLQIAITTAGFNLGSFCYQHRKQMIDVLNQNLQLDDHFVMIFGLDEKDKFDDPAVWEKAQPSIRYIPTLLPDLQSKIAMAMSSASALNNVKTKLLNMWVSNESSYIDVTKWDACKSALPFEPELFTERPAFIGVDLSSKRDLTSICLVFPPYLEDENWHYVWKTYIPSDTVRDREQSNSDFRFREWINNEELIEIPGALIDLRIMENDIVKWTEDFNVSMVAVDQWHFQFISPSLEARGLTVVEIGQNWAELSEATKTFEANVVARKVVHYSDTLIRWQISNVTVLPDNMGNVKPIKDKRNSSRKIDSIAAAITATSAAIRMPVEDDAPFYASLN